MLEIIAKKRSQKVSEHYTPCVLYGKGIDSTISLEISTSEVVKLYNKIVNEGKRNDIVTLKLDGKEYKTIIKEIQRHSVHGNVLHMDFFSIDKTSKFLLNNIRVNYLNKLTAPVAKVSKISYNNPKLKVQCTGLNTITMIDCDLNDLEPGKRILAKDLKWGEGIRFLDQKQGFLQVVEAKKKKEKDVQKDAPKK